MRMTRRIIALFSVMLALLLPRVAKAADMYRLYNPNSGEHFYTANVGERNSLVRLGWNYEGVGWVAPEKSATPVYRLYNPNAGDHHYTISKGERDALVRLGWNYEGIGWYSDDAQRVPLYRQYNPNAVTGTHNYTTSKGENDALVRAGWRAEGVGWYGTGAGRSPQASDNIPSTSSKKQEFQARYDRIEADKSSDRRMADTTASMSEAGSDYSDELEALMNDMLDYMRSSSSYDNATINSSQRAWEARLEAALDEVDADYPPDPTFGFRGTLYPLARLSAYMTMYEERIEELLAMM